MTTYCIGSNKSFKAVSGSLTAEIQKFGKHDGKATHFLTNETTVVLMTRHQIDEKNWSDIDFRFPATLQSKRYEFYDNGPLKPPSFSQGWVDENGFTWFRPHYSRIDAGFIDIQFDLAAGTLDAKFNFTIKENPTETERQVVGQMTDIKGLEHVKFSFENT